MSQGKVMQPKVMAIQSGNPNAQNTASVFQKVSEGRPTKGFKSPTWVRNGTETMAQMARLLRGKLTK